MDVHAISEGLKNLSTPSVSDAMDRIGVEGCCLGLLPLFNKVRMAGPAFTVRYRPISREKGTVGDFIDDIPARAVVVIDNGGRIDCTVWGDILTQVALRRGLSGTVIDGVCRDVDLALDNQYPIFSRGRYMRTGKDRIELAEVGGTVQLSNIPVRPNDIILGDSNGVVVVPWDCAEAVLRTAQEIEATEARIISEVSSGTTLREARRNHAYHLLQRKGS
ncbi:RraA family protein [Rhodoligotrophos defluvii]|uniref:RraA family protein n=1 Tax=Rhodoligotrophos defluvii TaxID=2561934 RepID=UPI0010CA0CDE|nr:RraA family protein [Rhodoligotrophos defluvii]